MAILFDTVFTKFVSYLGEEISDFRLCCGRFLPRKFKLISENFTLIKQKFKHFRFPTYHNRKFIAGGSL